jgi:predicted Zn-dependent peptidase
MRVDPSVTTGFWVGVGGRDEPQELSGASHFLEHLLFKGTEARTARQIAEAVDAVGGEMNAFTSREHTAYYTRLPSDALGMGLELLVDVLTAPAFRPHEVDAERQVILEEILMNEDTPEDLVHTALADALFPAHPLGREVLGTPETIEAMTRDEIRGFFLERYRPANVVIVAAGALDHDAVAEGVVSCFAGVDPGARPRRTAPAAPPRPFAVLRRPSEQAHVAIGWRGVDHEDPDRYALTVCNQILGGGMASRLFQEVREERGLVYSVYSYLSSYSDSGAAGIYAGTGPQRARETLKVIDGELERLLADGVTEQELAVAHGYLEGSLLLGLEDSGGRMARLGRAIITRGQITPVAEHVHRIRAVTVDDVARVARRVFDAPRTLAVVGPFDEADFALPLRRR